MISKVNSICLRGMDGFPVMVETDIAGGLPAFDIVGLPDAAVKESKERIRAALKNTGVPIPGKKLTVNLAPANVRKEGAHLDLAIAMGILAAEGHVIVDEADTVAFLGELSLDGDVRSVNGMLPMVISAYQSGFKRIYVPVGNAEEAAIVKGVEVYGAENLAQLIEVFCDGGGIPQTVVDVDAFFASGEDTMLDFADVKGQESVKRALEIAAAGSHNCLLIGPPGSGKTMLAQRIPSVLPNMALDEALEVTKIHSIAGSLPDDRPMVTQRPFRSPHHTISAAGLSGGGSIPKPGEISLSHNGVLFLDELPEFRKDALEVLRQPLEDGTVTISRASGTFSYPCNIMLVASMNPCPCGYFGDSVRTCSCSPERVSRYLSRVSGPLLDRIDIHIEVPTVKYNDLSSSVRAESSRDIRGRINAARAVQTARYAESGIFSNSQLAPAMMERFCALSERSNALLKQSYEKLGLSARAHNRILKVARTIADLDKSDDIEMPHLAEAIQYRSLDRKFWARG